MTAVLFAGALGALLWPSTRAEVRLAALAGARAHAGARWPIRPVIVLVPVALLAFGGWAVATVGVVGVALVLRAVRRRGRERELDAETADLLTALSVMIAELEIGAPPPRACAVAAAETRRRRGDSAITRGLTTMAGRAELGGGVWAAVDPGAGVNQDATSWRRIGVAWQTSDSFGLPMVDLLRSLRSDVLSRRQFRERTRAGLAGPRATAMVLAGLPALGIGLGWAIGAHPLTVLLSPGLGGVLLVVGVGLASAGLVWSQRITDKVLSG